MGGHIEHSLGRGGALHTPCGCQRPVLARVGAEGALSRVAVDLQLEGFLVCLLVLIGGQVHAWGTGTGKSHPMSMPRTPQPRKHYPGWFWKDPGSVLRPTRFHCQEEL